MTVKNVSRRQFVGGVAAAIGYAGFGPSVDVFAQGNRAARQKMPLSQAVAEYDQAAKLANNENPFGPPDSVIKAMTNAFKYANRYGYPDGGIIDAICEYHGVKPENILLGAGSSEILTMTDATFLQTGKKIVGVEPTYNTVYQYATNSHAEAIKLPLLKDYQQDIPLMIHTVKTNYRDVGFVYLCNPNNPTAMIIPKQQVKQLLDGIPEDVPVLIDEAYHHFVDDPNYETSIEYVKEGRRVIIARTFSKIVGLAGMRLGYAVAPKTVIDEMRPYAMSYGINAIVKWGGAEALRDLAAQDKVRTYTIAMRKKTTSELNAYGYETLPTQTNFFMVHIGREVVPVIDEFKKKNVLVGRPFPPMTQHLRVSIGTEDEMARFMAAFKEIFPAKGKTSTAADRG